MTEDLTYDFKYEDEYLSDFGFVVCRFGGSSELDINSGGAKISFSKVPMHHGQLHGLTNSKYDECITATFDICKDPCNKSQGDMEISNDEYRDIARWLNRRDFHKFQVVGSDVFYNASFNLEKICLNGALYGIKLTMETDKPFGYGEEVKVSISASNSSTSYKVRDINDEIGQSYPYMKIICGANGNLTIYNSRDSYSTEINGCSFGEVIVIDGQRQIISSSLSSHKIQNSFNYEFPKLINSFDNRDNYFRFSLPCEVKIVYNPIIKDTPVI